MSHCKKACALSRRRFIQLTAAGAASAGAIGEAAAQAEDSKNSFKGTKEQAGYIQKSEPSAQDCSTCHSFIEPDECQLVEGPVSPMGWCNWYSD